MADPATALRQVELIDRGLKSRLGLLSPRQNARLAWIHGAALIGLNRPAEALKPLDGAIASRDGFADQPKLSADILLAHGTAKTFVGDFEPAILEYRQAYRLYESARYRRGQALALQDIGMIYVLARDFDHALTYFSQSADVAGEDPSLALSIANNVGGARKEQGRFAAAISSYGRALQIARQLDSAVLQVRVLCSLAQAQVRAGHIADAAKSVKEGLRLSESGPASEWRGAVFASLAELQMRRGNLAEASIAGAQALSRESGNSAPALRDLNLLSYRIWKARGDDSAALRYLETFKRLDDQTRAIAASANAALMSAQFDFANQQAAIGRLKAQDIANEARITRGQRTTLLILLGASGLVTMLLLAGFLSIRSSRNRERAANEELSAANEELGEALEARTRFLATTSHEIRTPLNGILGMTQVLLADRALDVHVRSKIDLVHGAGQTMRALVDDILDVAKMTNGEIVLHPAPMDLHRLLLDTAGVWEAQAQTKGIEVVLDYGSAPVQIVADEVRLRQIVFNLVSNAVKFTDRGEVRIVAASSGADAPGGEWLRIQVSDTGIGIPADKLDEVFESFRQVDGGTTRRHGGTGLGLAICRGFAEAMGGSIAVESIVGAGATFTIDVPLRRVDDPIASAVRTRANDLASTSLLLVERNPLTQSILRALLAPKLRAFALAADVADAAEIVRRGGIDLLLADGNTLDRSIAAVTALAAPVRLAGGNVVLLWPAPDDKVAEEAAHAGANLLLPLPIAAPDLVSALSSLYEEARSAQEEAA